MKIRGRGERRRPQGGIEDLRNLVKAARGKRRLSLSLRLS